MQLRTHQLSDITIRRMTIEDYRSIVQQWMSKEGWNPGKFDEQIYFSGNKKQTNFFVLQIKDTIIAALMVFAYNQTFSFFGAYITHESFRKQGYGMSLWKEVMTKITSEIICAYAVPKQLATYAKSGFTNDGLFNTRRWQGIASNSIFKNPKINKITKENIAEVNEYDKEIFHADRQSFLQALSNLPSSNFICSHDYHEKITGLAAIRPAEKGYRIGPIEANTPQIAIDLVLELLGTIPTGQYIFLDSDSRNPYVMQFAEYFHLDYVHEANCIAICKGHPPQEQYIEKKYALLSLELG